MQYWVFSDSRVLGPFSKEDLASVQGLSQDSLVSKADSSSGAREGDWAALSALPELSSLYSGSVGVALAPAVESTGGPFDQFRSESHEILERIGYPEAWISGIFEDSQLFGVHAGLGDEFGAITSRADKEHTAELENRLCQLQLQLEEFEKHQNDILDKLGEKDKTIEALRSRLMDYEAGRAAPARAPQAPPPKKTPPPMRRSAPPPMPAEPQVPAPVEESVPAFTDSAPAAELPPSEFAAYTAADIPTEGEIAPLAEAPFEPPAMEVASLSAAAPVAEPEAPPPFAEPEAPPPFAEPEAVPMTQALNAVSSMPDAEDFVPPMPEDVEASPWSALAGEVPPLDPPPLSAPIEEVAPLEPVPAGMPLDPPPMDLGAPPMYPAAALMAGPEDMGGPPDSGQQPHTMMFSRPATQAPAWGDLAPGPAWGPSSGSITAGPDDLAPGAMPGQAPTPMPIPLGGMNTPMPAMGQPDIPQTVLQGMGVGGTTTPIPGSMTPPSSQSFEELMGRPVTAAPMLTPSQPMDPLKTGLIRPPTDTGSQTGGVAKPGRRPSKKILIGLGIAVVVLIVLLLLFFRNPTQLKQSVDMSPQQNAPETLNAGSVIPTSPPAEQVRKSVFPGRSPGQTPPADPQQQAEAFPPAQQRAPAYPPPQQQAQSPAQAPPAASGGGSDFIQDNQVQAMEFVKNYMLSGAKGTVEGWLSYSFPPPNMPQWSAGAISKDVWLVEYLVYKGPRSKKPEITYSFEVNVSEESIKPRNSQTKSLLSGSESMNKKANFLPPSKELQPLPGDDELGGAQSGGASGFNNPGD